MFKAIILVLLISGAQYEIEEPTFSRTRQQCAERAKQMAAKALATFPPVNEIRIGCKLVDGA